MIIQKNIVIELEGNHLENNNEKTNIINKKSNFYK